MNRIPLTKSEIDLIISLRKAGHSLPEIREITKRGSGTIYKHVKNVDILPENIALIVYKI